MIYSFLQNGDSAVTVQFKNEIRLTAGLPVFATE